MPGHAVEQEPDSEEEEEKEEQAKVEEKKKQMTQTAESMAEFMENLPKLQFHLIAAEACAKVNELCKCGSGLYRLIACDECYDYEATCEKCFIRDHYHHPFHWAKVWQTDGFFLKVDISYLENNTYTIQLPCSKGSSVCKDTYNNFRKNVEMPQLFLRLYKDAVLLSRRKHRAFISACITYRDRAASWEEKAQRAKRYSNGIIQGIYQHHSKVPSQEKIYQQLLLNNATSFADGDAGNMELYLIQQGLAIQHEQQRIRGKLTLNQTETVKKDIAKQRKALTEKISVYRDTQKSIIPAIEDMLVTIYDKNDEVKPEDENLLLPSNMTPAHRQARDLGHLAALECKMREGELYDYIQSVQNAAKSYSITHDQKKQERGTNANTQSQLKLKRIEVERDSCIADYNRVRKALLDLGGAQPEELPAMSLSDTYRYSTVHPRALGDLRETDGALYTMLAEQDDEEEEEGIDEGDEMVVDEPMMASTQGTRRQRRKAQRNNVTKGKEPETKPNGWIWTKRLMFGVSGQGQNLSEFEEECDQIEYFRKKAEDERWREVCETIHAELFNYRRGCQTMEAAWSKSAACPLTDNDGHN
ncbi:hypothetical protein BT96DRAFT_997514 [Gymnopus androsaceus JB14]|uniref:CxC2-like cysteine cluster KDZ transposase-associated domain-containing protein n=1 Tax=Gymnopus androsaceus JB14 TaxID=1447944 RepID=A0A6A4HES1_9AGAR|nr:hypothetical protein BT96DRAFT_997514 [Gymnopus androsaceus JB14]